MPPGKSITISDIPSTSNARVINIATLKVKDLDSSNSKKQWISAYNTEHTVDLNLYT